MNKRIEGIIATTEDGTIGVGNRMAWHHPGDFRRFAALTRGHVLLMGTKTFLGIAEHYFKPGKEILPGRTLCIIGRTRNGAVLREDLEAALRSMGHNIPENLYAIENSYKDPVDVAKHLSDPDQTLFISGGARIYDMLLRRACKIHHTIITGTDLQGEDLVKIAPETLNLLQNNARILHGEEVSGDLKASYWTVYLS